MGDSDLTPAERAELDEWPTCWPTPRYGSSRRPDLQEAVVAAIADEAGAAGGGAGSGSRLAGVAAAVLLAAG